MGQYLISVIIPVYNVERYIRDCLESVINQTLGIDQIEVIIVNDCTPDKSMLIVREYEKNYHSINVIERNSNGGAGAARNTGLDHVTSEYVTFLDPDDFITPNTFEHLLKNAKEKICDLVIYEYDYYSPSGKTYPRNPSEGLFSEDRLITDITKTPEIIFATSVCNKLFRATLFENLRFEETKFEDVLVSTITTFASKRIYVTNGCKYFYRKREDSIGESTMDNYLEKRDSYFDHLHVNTKMYQLIANFPQYKELIDWFNARSYAVFLVNSLKKKFISFREKSEIYNQAKIFLQEVPDHIVEKLENPIYLQALYTLRDSKFHVFFTKIGLSALTRKLKAFIQKSYKVIEVLFLLLIFKLLPKKHNVWLICERGFEARDNGYHLFKYIRENYKDINAYYLIDKKNKSDYLKVSSLGNVVQYKSLKHKLLFIQSSKLISAHKGTVEPWNYIQFRNYFGKLVPSKKYIFLQHGITKDDVSNILGKENAPFDLFITGAKPEYEYISSHFGYDKDEVVYTGLARFDALYNQKTDNTILLMPTWRNGIVQKSWNKTRLVSDETFLSSEYYSRYQSFINNNKLFNLLQDYNYKLIFYPHFEVQPYLKYFTTKNNNIILANHDKYDVQELLIKSKLLITDFSSVFFDFAYMLKPVLYYQFDKNYFYSHHYRKGYFDYQTDGFGEVSSNEDEIIELLIEYFKNDFKMKEKYKERVKLFYPLRDRENCKRIFEEIVNLE